MPDTQVAEQENDALTQESIRHVISAFINAPVRGNSDYLKNVFKKFNEIKENPGLKKYFLDRFKEKSESEFLGGTNGEATPASADIFLYVTLSNIRGQMDLHDAAKKGLAAAILSEALSGHPGPWEYLTEWLKQAHRSHGASSIQKSIIELYEMVRSDCRAAILSEGGALVVTSRSGRVAKTGGGYIYTLNNLPLSLEQVQEAIDQGKGNAKRFYADYVELVELINRASLMNDEDPTLFAGIKLDQNKLTKYIFLETSRSLFVGRIISQVKRLLATRRLWKSVGNHVKGFGAE